MPQSSPSGFYPPQTASATPSQPKPGEPRFLDQVANACRVKHLAYRTEQAYVGWVKSPANRPLNQAIAWPGSLRLSQQDMQDAYRVVKPDEVKAPGNTWTPRYPTGTSGRRDYGMQVRETSHTLVETVEFTWTKGRGSES